MKIEGEEFEKMKEKKLADWIRSNEELFSAIKRVYWYHHFVDVKEFEKAVEKEYHSYPKEMKEVIKDAGNLVKLFLFLDIPSFPE
jgi:protein associated with RNAse G/E